MTNCPLCKTISEPIDGACRELKLEKGVEHFFRCDGCGSVFVPERLHLDEDNERERYGEHNNQADNEGYRGYLSSVADKVASVVPDFETKRILDYGAGENFVLTTLLKERNIIAEPYDPNYESLATIDGEFDVIIACESIEHFRDPLAEFEKMTSHLKSGGHIWIRTEHLESAPYFSAWWYKNDPTHIFFYSEKTMNWLGKRFGLDLVMYDEKNISMFQKR